MTLTSAVYSFLPYLRQGMATAIQKPDLPDSSYKDRPTIDVDLNITTSSGEKTIPRKVSLYDPRDIVGINPNIVKRTSPANGSVNVEPNYLPLIEFSEADFPWRYTPAKENSGHLRPWITLIVLENDVEFTEPVFDPANPIRFIKVNATKCLPNPQQTWAWAHVQILNKVDGPISDILSQNPDRVTSRILCPRKLEPNKSYTAFLVPSFEGGRLAGLDKKETPKNGTLMSAWDGIQTGLELPYYFRFAFSTGEEGDFESLVRKLKPAAIPEEVGIRNFYVMNPGNVLGLEGALKSASTKSSIWNDSKATTFQKNLETILNSQEKYLEMKPDDLKVAPPIYGKWYAEIKKISQDFSSWINELNLDPRYRVLAGLGALVIKNQQDKLMNSAWNQVEDIEKINQKLRQSQLAREISKKHYNRLGTLQKETFLTVTSSLHTKILGSKITIRQRLKESMIPSAALSHTLQNIARSRGPIRKRQFNLSEKPTTNMLSRINDGQITAAPNRIPSENIAEMNKISDSLYPKWSQSWSRKYLWIVPWLVIGIGLFLLGISFLIGILFSMQILLLIPIVMISAGFVLLRNSTKWKTASTLRFETLTPEVIQSIPQRPQFKLMTIWSTNLEHEQTTTTNQDSADAEAFREASMKLQEKLLKPINVQITKKPADINYLSNKIFDTIDPSKTIASSVKNRLKIDKAFVWQPEDPIEPIMAAPTFPQPMYEPLRDMSQEYLLPGLEKIPYNCTCVLLSNQKFIESYMVGLNHSMSDELFWREFPTDRRGTYFQQFWDIRGCVMPNENGIPEKMKDIKQIHTWKNNLSTHSPKDTPNKDYIVFLIRGDLLRRYPNTVIYAVKAEADTDPGSKFTRKVVKDEIYPNKRDPLFRGTLFPDITFLGFDLTVEEARGNLQEQGWYFVIQEQATEPKFGLDVANLKFYGSIADWNELSWSHIVKDKDELDALCNIDVETNRPSTMSISNPDPKPDPIWGNDSAHMAHILFQRQMRIVVHASDMIDKGVAQN